jgi:Flp pilus assembly pilin Flp
MASPRTGAGHDNERAVLDRATTRWERGASLVEYALLVALITIVCLAALQSFGDENDGLIQGSTDEIVQAGGG